MKAYFRRYLKPNSHLPRRPFEQLLRDIVGLGIALLVVPTIVLYARGGLTSPTLLIGSIGIVLCVVIWMIVLPICNKRFRWSEINAGRCPKCRYRLDGHHGSGREVKCPECGSEWTRSMPMDAPTPTPTPTPTLHIPRTSLPHRPPAPWMLVGAWHAGFLFYIPFVLYLNINYLGSAVNTTLAASILSVLLIISFSIVLPIRNRCFKKSELTAGRCPTCRYTRLDELYDGNEEEKEKIIRCPVCESEWARPRPMVNIPPKPSKPRRKFSVEVAACVIFFLVGCFFMFPHYFRWICAITI